MSEIHGATGSYVLNALDADELEEFEAHLAVCPTCSREVVEFCETAAELSLLASAPPPPALKGSVMSAISGVRVLPPDVPADDQTAPVDEPRPQPVAAAAPVDELALRRQRRLTRVLSLAVAAALVVALGLGGWVVALTQRDVPVATSTLETELLNAADVKGYTIELAEGGEATFVASKSLGRALFSSGDLPALPADQTYQLWTLAGSLDAPTRVTPDNIVSGGAPAKSWLRGPVAESDALAISVEPAGGADTPTTIVGATAL
ncbi:anti-sigma factor [Microlunatus lacustris]